MASAVVTRQLPAAPAAATPAPPPPAGTPFAPGGAPAVSLASARHAELVSAIRTCGGVLRVRDLAAGTPPWADVGALFDALAADPATAARANAAYTKNLVYKDAAAAGRGGPGVDAKRVVDLSPARLEAVAAADPALVADLAARLDSSLVYFNTARTVDVPRLQAALADAAGVPALGADRLCNYRLVDYYERAVGGGGDDGGDGSGAAAAEGPRCGKHRDFGSMTLVFPSGPGLEACADDGTWAPVATRPDEAVLLFGWCAAFRSNNRIPAVLHRVSDGDAAQAAAAEAAAAAARPASARVAPRRLSAIFFVAPDEATPLEPVVAPGEAAAYKPVTAGTLRAEIGRKWRAREGTLNAMGQAADAAAAGRYATQDAYIAGEYAA